MQKVWQSFQLREQQPRVYTAVKPRVYVNAVDSEQQSTTSRDLNVTGDPLTDYEALDAEDSERLAPSRNASFVHCSDQEIIR